MLSVPKIKSKDIFFWSAYFIFLVVSILNTSFYVRYFIVPTRYIYFLCFLLLIVHEITQLRATLKVLFFALVGLLLSLMLIYTTNNVIDFIIILAFVYAGRKQSFEKIIQITIWISIFLLIFIVMSSYLGIIENYVWKSNMRTRKYLGFRYSLYAPAYLLNISTLIVYYYKEKIKWKHIFTVLIFNTWFYIETGSRLSYFLSLFLVFVAILLKYKTNLLNKRRLICYLMITSVLICSILSVYITITYDNSSMWQRNLNSILSNRLRMGQISWLNYGISIFGREMKWVGNGLDTMGRLSNDIQNYNYVDNLYLRMIQQYGIIFTALFFAVNIYAATYYYKKKDYYMLICLTIISVHMMIDDLTFYLNYNTFWFAIGFGIFKTNQKLKASKWRKDKNIEKLEFHNNLS